MIGIKYCGGCNSGFDRVNALKRYSEEFDIKYEYAHLNSYYDTLLVICGCDSMCADMDGYMYNNVIMIDNEKQLAEILKKLK